MDLTIILDDYESGPLYRQIYDEIRKAILYGRLQPGQKLPSTRELANSLKVSRITVTQGYDQLLAEGYIKTITGAGTFVSEQIPDFLLYSPRLDKQEPIGQREYHLSEYGQRVAALPPAWQSNHPPGAIWFQVGALHLDAFPWAAWMKLVSKHCRPDQLGYTAHCFGNDRLRKELADHLYRARAVNCTPEQIVIVNGTIHALDLISRLLIAPGDKVIVEEPGWPAARRHYELAGASGIPVDVDDDGLVTDKLPEGGNCKLVFLTPSHQFPTGVVLSLKRRLELLSWAERNNAILIEDDYESELRYAGRPVPSLQGLDRGASVIYVGTFSKTLFPSLRIGYVVLPESLVAPFARAKGLNIWESQVTEQLALADFLAEGHYDRYMRKMRQIYGNLRNTLVAALNRYLGESVEVIGDSTGMHLMIRIQSDYSDDDLIARAREQGVIIGDGRLYYCGKSKKSEFPLGYGGLNCEQIEEGVRRLSLALK